MHGGRPVSPAVSLSYSALAYKTKYKGAVSMYEVYQDHPKQARLNIRVVLAVAFLVCAIGAGIFLITRLVSKPLTKEDARGQTGIVYDSSAVEGGWDNLSPEEIAEKLNEKVAEGMINISMNTAPYFENGTADGNIVIVNESINNYPQKVQIIRNDTGEQIYESGAIAVGSKIERAKLDVALPAGTYECTAYFHNLDPETGEIIGTAGAIINITIQH
jgi:hypothetical protein